MEIDDSESHITDTNGSDAVDTKVDDAPRGKPKSGKIWKSPKQRATTVKKSTHGRTDLRKQVLLKEEIRKAKELSEVLKNERQNEVTARKERQDEAKKRKEENARKSEVVQVIKNTKKLKRMKKSQLRTIETRAIPSSNVQS